MKTFMITLVWALVGSTIVSSLSNGVTAEKNARDEVRIEQLINDLGISELIALQRDTDCAESSNFCNTLEKVIVNTQSRIDCEKAVTPVEIAEKCTKEMLVELAAQ